MFKIATFAVATLAAGLAMAVLAGPAAAGSIRAIDCDVRLNAAETRICSSQKLQILDARITEKYADLMDTRGRSEEQHEALRDSQYAFLQRRDQCGNNYGCLLEVMHRRATRIDYYR